MSITFHKLEEGDYEIFLEGVSIGIFSPKEASGLGEARTDERAIVTDTAWLGPEAVDRAITKAVVAAIKNKFNRDVSNSIEITP